MNNTHSTPNTPANQTDKKAQALANAKAAAEKAVATRTAAEATAQADAVRAAQAAPASTSKDATKSTEKKLSPKHKDSRGVPAGYKTTWVPLDLPAEENERLQHVAAVRGTKVTSILANILLKELAKQKAELDADAAKYVGGPKAGEKEMERLSKMDETALEAEVAKQMAKIKALRCMVASKKSAE